MQKAILKNVLRSIRDPTAGFVLGISTLLFWAGIIIVIVAIGWIVYGWYIDRKTTTRRRSIGTGHRKK